MDSPTIDSRRRVTILVPCYNEELTLGRLYAALRPVMDSESGYEWQLLLVNDGSRDATMRVVRELRAADPRVCYVDLSRNFGKERAMLAGFDHASGDCLVVMDADLQDPPALIPQMLRLWEQGYDDVYARRASRGRESWLRRRLSLLFYAILERSTRFEVLKNVGDFRLLDRRCVDALREMRESERYTKGMFCWIGYRKREIVFDRGDRVAGESAWNFLSLFNLAVEGIVSFTTAPLRFSTLLGLVIAVAAFVLGAFYVAKTVFCGDPVQGFTTIITVVLFMGGVQLMSIGILGEYVGRIFNESKHRPVYLVRESEGV